jgi:hypothetical protein
MAAKTARYAPAPKAPVRRSHALISRILSFLLRAPHARARGQAMKGLLYIIPADPKAIRERCEITAPPTVEELRKIVGGYIGIVHGFTSIDMLLILSKHSIKSDWVEDEVTKGFEEERKRGQIVLFPVRLDQTVMKTNEAWAAKLRGRLIGDFRRWKDHNAYKESFERVVRDLAIPPIADRHK